MISVLGLGLAVLIRAVSILALSPSMIDNAIPLTPHDNNSITTNCKQAVGNSITFDKRFLLTFLAVCTAEG